MTKIKLSSEELLQLYNTFNSMGLENIKARLRIAVKKRANVYGTRLEMSQKAGLSDSVFNSIINPAHTSNITFENFVKVCGTFNISFNEIFHTTEPIVEHKRPSSQIKWSDATKKEFIEYKDQYGVTATKNKYNLTEGSAILYYDKFTREMRKKI